MTDETTPPTSESTEPTGPAPDSFAAKLKAAREAAGLSKNKASQLLKITNATLNNYEQGKTKPSPHRGGAMLRKLKDAAPLSAEYLKFSSTKTLEVVGKGTIKVVPTPSELPSIPSLAFIDGSWYRITEIETTNPPSSEIGLIVVPVDAPPKSEVVVSAEPVGEIAKDATASVELDHDPYNPVTKEYLKGENATTEGAVATRSGVHSSVDLSLPDIPVGNVHTSQDGVIRRRLADDDEREGLELIGGRKWFTVGFAPPHPRAKPVNKPAATPPPAPLSSPVERPEPRVHTETTPVTPGPAEAIPAPALSGQRNWAWWNR